jgi:hypothetical protein
MSRGFPLSRPKNPAGERTCAVQGGDTCFDSRYKPSMMPKETLRSWMELG